MKDKKGKPVYFNAANFVQMVLKAIGMDKAEPKIQEQLGIEISQTLSERVTAAVVSSLDEKDLFLLEKTLEDHPELDEIDVLSIITPSVPGLEERILKEVGDLFEEMVANVKAIDQRISKSNKR